MEAPIPQELGLFEPGDHAKHALLFGIRQFGLKAHDIVTSTMDIFRSQLNDGGMLDLGPGIFQSDRLQRPNCIVWRPRSASTSIGTQASK